MKRTVLFIGCCAAFFLGGEDRRWHTDRALDERRAVDKRLEDVPYRQRRAKEWMDENRVEGTTRCSSEHDLCDVVPSEG